MDLDIGEDKTGLQVLAREAKTIAAQIGLIEEELKGEQDETRRKIAQEELEKKNLEFEGVQAKAKKIEERIEDKRAAMRKDFVDGLAKKAETDTRGKDLRQAAEATNQGRQDKVELQVVRDFILEGKSASDVPGKLRQKMFGRKMFNPGREVEAIKLPPRAVNAILGKQWTGQMAAAKDLMESYSEMEGKASCSGTGDYSTMPYASQNSSMTAAAIWTEYKRKLLDLPGEPADIVSRLTVVPAESGTAQWVRTTSTDSAEYAGVVAYWVTCEGDSKPATQVKFESFDIDCYELAAYTEITDRALARSLVPIEEILNSKFRDAVNHAVETAVLVGTGAGQPDGVIDVAGIHQIHRLCNTDVQCPDSVELEFALRRQHRPGSIYVMQDDVLKELKKDRFSGTDCDCAQCLENGTLNGYPYMSTHRLPALGTDGDVLFGNFREYILAVEQDIMLARSNVAGDMFRKNSTAFKVYMIVGGEVAQPRAFAQLVGCAGGSCCCAT